MLTLFGIDFVIDHVLSEIKRQSEERSYKIYVTDALRAIANNTAQAAVEQRSYTSLTNRWAEVIEPQEEPQEIEEDTRPCEEIAADIWKRIRKKGGK